MMGGKFITLEGIEGVGKTTALACVQQVLTQYSVAFLLTREPGGTVLGERIREILLTKDQLDMQADTELLLFFAARMENIAQVIAPTLRTGQWVIADRYIDASFAYQGGGRGASQSLLQTLEQEVRQQAWPDLTLLLDAPVEVGLARMRARATSVQALDRIERLEVDFFERVRACYLARAHSEPERFAVIDAAKPLEQVTKQIQTVLIEKFFD